MRKFSISDIEAISGIKAHTIRIWEQRYEFIVSKRTDTNIRYYDEKDLCLFLNISSLSEHGFKISEIARMLPEEMMEAVSRISPDHHNPCMHVNALADATLQFNEAKFLNTICLCTKKKGLENAMVDTIFPFMRKMGLMWQTGTITPAHEHFASDLIKRKLVCSINAITEPCHPEAKKFMLFLPENETNEIGLLFAQFLICSQGHKVLYLGQNIPYESLETACNSFEPDYCVTTLTSVLIENEVNNVIDKIASHLPNRKLIVSGPLILPDTYYPSSNIIILKCLTEISEFFKEFQFSHA